MTTNHHTSISDNRQPANAATFNAPLGQLDSVLSGNVTEVQAARGAYGSLDDRLDALVLSGGNISTLASGAQSAGATSLVVDDTTGFTVGAKIVYAKSGGGLEYNTIGDIPDGTHLTVSATGGIIPDDTVIAMISASEAQAAGGYSTMPDRLDGIDKYPGVSRQAANSAIGATSLTLRTALNTVAAYTGWVAIDPFTSDCEIRKITNISGAAITVANLTYAHAAGDAIMPIPDPRRLPAQLFGAKFDGSTDDLTALNRAILQATALGGAEIILPEGTTRISNVIDWRANVSMRGAGIDKTTIKLADNPGGTNRGIYIANRINAQLRDFTLDMNGAATGTGTEQEAIVVYATNSTGITGCMIERVKIKDGNDAGLWIRSAGATYPLEVTVRDCVIDNFVSVGIYLYGNAAPGYDRVRLLNNEVKNNDAEGIWANRSDNLLIQGNNVHENGWMGITVGYSESVIIANNHVWNNDTDQTHTDSNGITAHVDADYITIANNICYGNGGNGISIDPREVGNYDLQPVYGTVIGNVCQGNQVHGIVAKHSYFVTITGNVCYANDAAGIVLHGEYLLAAHNVLNSNGTYGIDLQQAVGENLENNRIGPNVLLANVSGSVSDSQTGPNYKLGDVKSTYTATNVSSDRAYDANSTDVAELADVLGTLIADLRAAGIVG